MSRPAYFVGPWDLHRNLACVPRHPADGTVVIVESVGKSRALPYHRQKLVLVLSALRHFAEELRADGFDVDVRRAGRYVDGIARHVAERGSTEVRALAPREWGLDQSLRSADRDGTLGAPLVLADDGGPGGHFFLTRDEVREWAKGRKELRMHHFYGWMRKRFGFLMDDDKPAGGKLSFDADNRKHARGQTPPAIDAPVPDEVTRAVMEQVEGWDGHWGSADGFAWPVTRAEALAEMERFFTTRAEGFGPYQDAMLADEPFMWHARLSSSLNLSLLHPREVCDRLEEEYRAGRMPLASAEGLLRQILGWREFIRAVYWLKMPGLRTANALGAERRLPQLYWDPAATEMRCLQQSVGQVKTTGYGHHIQRLMVLGNFALLAGIDPLEISHWFWAGFVDAYEWVELPNVHGMAVFADDTFTTKPYAASGAYVNKMSDYCKGCRYRVKERTGPDACPFNPLFWSFLARHRELLSKNPRMRMLYRAWDRFGPEEQAAIERTSAAVLDALTPETTGWTVHDDQG